MGFFESYKNYLQSKGGSCTASRINSSKYEVNKNFKEDPAYREATLTRRDGSAEKIDTRVVNNSSKLEEKNIYLRPDTTIEVGSYLHYNHGLNKTYLVTEYEYNLIAPFYKALESNLTLKWKDRDGVIHEMPCSASNDAYGVKIVANENDGNRNNTKLKIKVQNNAETRKITPDTRFIFNHSKYDIYKITKPDWATMDGIITFIAEIDEMKPEDDLENSLAYNFYDTSVESNPTTDTTKPLEPYTINGDDVVLHKNDYSYSISPITNCNWELDEMDVACDIAEIVNQNATGCVIYAKETSSVEKCTLYAKQGAVVLAKKEITIKRKL